MGDAENPNTQKLFRFTIWFVSVLHGLVVLVLLVGMLDGRKVSGFVSGVLAAVLAWCAFLLIARQLHNRLHRRPAWRSAPVQGVVAMGLLGVAATLGLGASYFANWLWNFWVSSFG